MSIGVVETDGKVTGPYKVDVSRGQRIGRVSSEWFSRPGDERYLRLADLYAAAQGRAEHSVTRIVESKAVRVEASSEDGEGLSLVLPGRLEPLVPTHWSSHGRKEVKALWEHRISFETVSDHRSEPAQNPGARRHQSKLTSGRCTWQPHHHSAFARRELR